MQTKDLTAEVAEDAEVSVANKANKEQGEQGERGGVSSLFLPVICPLTLRK